MSKSDDHNYNLGDKDFVIDLSLIRDTAPVYDSSDEEDMAFMNGGILAAQKNCIVFTFISHEMMIISLPHGGEMCPLRTTHATEVIKKCLRFRFWGDWTEERKEKLKKDLKIAILSEATQAIVLLKKHEDSPVSKDKKSKGSSKLMSEL